MKKIILSALFLIVITCSNCFSQTDQQTYQTENISNTKLTRNLDIDSKIIFMETKNDIQTVNYAPRNIGRKSPYLAGLFSLVLPGAGQFYADHYLEAGIFAVIEGALITTAVVYNNKANTQTNNFENYADKNWSVVKYAEWLAKFAGADINKIVVSDNTNLPPWERINWVQLHAAEIGSHELPIHGTQQYYELIGKYDQYSPGWDDYNSTNSDYTQRSPNFLSYAVMRGKANSLYTSSNTAVIGIFVNHVLSVIDAVWDVSRYNNQFALRFRLNPQYYYADSPLLVPTVNLSYSF
jgi:hypothetical protein